MRRRTSTSNGVFPDGYIQQVSWCTFFEAYILLLSGLSRNHLFYSMSMPESDLISYESVLPVIRVPPFPIYGQGLYAMLARAPCLDVNSTGFQIAIY
jgi:hypothetical protein